MSRLHNTPAWLLVASAALLLVVGFILSANISPSPSFQPSAAVNHGRKPVGSGSGQNFVSPDLQNGPRLRETPFISASREFDENDLPQNIPVEWEDEFFAIFEENSPTDEVDRRLIELATGKAAGETRVQVECLRHLAYSLPDTAAKDIAFLAAHNSIPKELREEFLVLAVSARPPQLSEDVRASLLRLGAHELADRIFILSYPETRIIINNPG